MEKFAKSILNYFATYTETRFSFQRKIDYKWTDSSLTADLSVFPKFQQEILASIKNGKSLNFIVKKGQYSVALDQDLLKASLLKRLESNYNLDFLKSCIVQAQAKLSKTESDKRIVAGEAGSGEITANAEFQKKVFSEGARLFNLSFRDAAKEILLSLQKQKIEELRAQLKFSSQPLSTLNPNSIEQEIFDSLQERARKSQDIESYYLQIKDFLKKASWDLLMYDLYATIRKFTPVIGTGTSYLFFHEICKENLEGGLLEKYPLFLVEVEIKEGQEEVLLKSTRDIVIINTPAVNSFGFEHILTTPRAARFVDAQYYLGSVERHVQNNYDIFESFLLEHAFKSLQATNKPTINFRIGLQVVQNENRKLLDYSELITHIDAGQGDKFIDFVKNYVSGNVKNTTDEVDREYIKKYPKKSVNNLISTIPLSLNKPQKRILTALENPKNKIIVVDGPPGTGKSYTIAAITYWANQQNKSVVITSHKKAALDVIDRMLTDKFKQLHPKAKPSVLRLSDEEGIGINNLQNSLSGPVISAASNRVNQFNDEAVTKDMAQWSSKVEKEIKDLWESSAHYKEHIAKLIRLEQLEFVLKEANIIRGDLSRVKIDKSINIDFNNSQEILRRIEKAKIDNLSLSKLSYIFDKRDLIEKLTEACDSINRLSINIVDIEKLLPFDADTLERFLSLIETLSKHLSHKSEFFIDNKFIKFKLSTKIASFFGKKQEIERAINASIDGVKKLEFDHIVSNIAKLLSKEREKLSIGDLWGAGFKLREINCYQKNIEILKPILSDLGFASTDIKKLYHFLSNIKTITHDLNMQAIHSLKALQSHFDDLLKNLGVTFDDIVSIKTLFSQQELSQRALEYLKLFIELSQTDGFNVPERLLISEYYQATQKKLEYINDKRLKNLNNYTGDIERIIVAVKTGKRLKIEELKVLLQNISCVIAEPDLISKYFPMDEDSIDILVIDEASQVSIAESISLILRAKQVVVFGDDFQYGAVSAVNVNEKYSRQYFKEILDNYGVDYRITLNEKEKDKISGEASLNINDEDRFVEPIYKPEEGTREWLKTFSIRTSTLNFAKAIKNYGTSLDTHFRSFLEIIDYSNEFFYKPNQIPLVINRIRTKPINEVLRFIKVETQGHSGNNINLDEIEAIKQDIQAIIKNGFKGTIGIIASFREQTARIVEILRKELPNYHALEKDHKLTIWFVGDVQGEERDIVYYSFVEDKKLGNADLRTIYPVIGGTADTPRSLKMQRLNVGFSRAKDTMVFVHSMPIEEYHNSQLGGALKFYKEILEKTKDNYIQDEAIFGSPAEKDLYLLITQTEFYKKNRDKIKIIVQFPIGKYIEETLHKFIPKYRVDFLITLSERGSERSLLLEYDGVEYHTKNPELVTEHNFSQEYLDYDVERQLELESYGYKFLRINKFTLIPKEKTQTKIDVLSSILVRKFKD